MVKPRHVLCVLGPEGWLPGVGPIVSSFGQGFELNTEYSLQEPDSRMPIAFDASFDTVTPTWRKSDLKDIRNHRSVAYVLSPPMTAETAIHVSTQALALAAKLLSSGGVAAKCESAGIAHGRAHWLHLAEEMGKDAPSQLVALHAAWVRRPIGSQAIRYTCGMHLLGLPDIECSAERLELQTVDLLDSLALRILALPVPRTETRLHDKGRELQIEHVECLRFPDDSFKFNPWGYIRVVS